MKPSKFFQGKDLAELFSKKATIRRKDKYGCEFVEYVEKFSHSLIPNEDGTTTFQPIPHYSIGICGINANGVPVCGSLRDCKSDRGNFFFQYADTSAVNDVLTVSSHAYNYVSVTNGIRETFN